jgi:hypothetical protein
MEPVEKFVKRILLVVFMIAAFIVALVFEEFGGKGWAGLAVLCVGGIAAGIGHALWKQLKKGRLLTTFRS